MIYHLAASLLALAAQTGVEMDPPIDCETADTQTALNICSVEAYFRADALLNEQWDRAADYAKDLDEQSADYDAAPDNFARLLDAQRKWLAYRDAHCLAVNGPRTETSGTIWPLVQNRCMEELTLARAELLRRYAEQGR